MIYLALDDVAGNDGRKQAEKVGETVGKRHENAGKAWCEVEMIYFEACEDK